ncbi:MAG: 30S ribosomal protein S4 [Chloroflexi bacterium]|nr:30S ribosomal protein S4 [Chloroflexota bacterium]MCL5109913.1 30S ribosomal protein S4 [Chloroflexota bacterium]
MARYTGPVCKICRRNGIKLMLKGDRCYGAKCAVESNRRPYGPGEHGQKRRRKVSEYGTQLAEKQKVRYIYGILERQFRKNFAEAERRAGMPGENLLRIMETRLDNVVYRLGFADSRNQARQIVRHGHFAVNGRKTNVPSFEVKVGDIIAVREPSKKLEYFAVMGKELGRKNQPGWLSVDVAALAGRVLALPGRTEAEPGIQDNLIVEFYSR